MINKYKQLRQEERDQIFLLKRENKLNTEIVKILGRNKSTIGRELKRNEHKNSTNIFFQIPLKGRQTKGKNKGEKRITLKRQSAKRIYSF